MEQGASCSDLIARQICCGRLPIPQKSTMKIQRYIQVMMVIDKWKAYGYAFIETMETVTILMWDGSRVVLRK